LLNGHGARWEDGKSTTPWPAGVPPGRRV
jgi:hypothetical protein